MKQKDLAAEICRYLISDLSVGHDGSCIYKQIQPFFWIRCPDKYFASEIRSALPDEVRECASTSCVQEGINRYLQMKSRILVFADQNSVFDHYIYIKNGILDVKTLILYPPESIKLNFRYGLNFSYLPHASEDAPYWGHFISTTFSDPDDVKRLLEFICCLVTGRKLKTAYFFLGPSNSGKSVLAEFIKNLIVPSTMCTAVSFEKFNDPFFLEELSRGYLNVVTELSEDCFKSSIVENFKKIVARETMTVSRKYHDPEEVRFRTSLLSCSNKPPRIAPNDLDAVLNRIEVLIFPKAVPKDYQIPNLMELLYSERDLIISQALRMVPRLEKSNYKLTPTSSSLRFMQQLVVDAPQFVLREFFEDCVILQQYCVTPTADVIKAFQLFVSLNGIGVKYSNKDIVRFFMAVNSIQKKKCRVSSYSNSIQCFVGITLRYSIVLALYAAGEVLLGDYDSAYRETRHLNAKPAFHFVSKPVEEAPNADEEKKIKLPFTFVDKSQSKDVESEEKSENREVGK